MSATDVDRIDTAVGPADVLHRLALGVECVDAVSGRRLRTDVAAGRELDALLLPEPAERDWPCRGLERKDTGRFQLRFDHGTPTALRLRLVDPRRRVVARRLELPLWSLADVRAAEATPPVVPSASRVLRPWLWPGVAAGLPRGATVVRGRVESGGAPVRWARVTAVRPGDGPVGRAHADERGEFVLLVTDTGSLPPPAPSTLDVDLEVVAPDPATAPPVDPDDRYADLVVEGLARASNPPTPAELDNPVLRGTAVPPGYVPNTVVAPTLTVPVGGELTLTEAIPFAA